MKTKITHLTSAHPRYDTRIFIKMCCSLAKKENYEVHLVVADGLGDELKSGVKILDVGAKKGGRISRMTTTVKKVFQKAKALKSQIYHLHDPELLPVGIKLKKLGYKVIFDAHEDLPKQILAKHYLNGVTKNILSKSVAVYESYTLKKFDFIISATPYIRDKFLKINKHCIDINNFPILDELSNDTPWSEKKDEVCYIGGIAKIRGIKEVVKAMELTNDLSLNLAGKFSEKEVEEEVKTYKGWTKVKELGFLDRSEIAQVLKNSKAGLVTLHPIINYLDALPVKMFEYMAAKLPVISSDIQLWKEIIEEAQCGICVDPHDEKAIANAMNYILKHPKEAQKMGENGRKAVLQKYNWELEEKKLYEVYEHLV